MKSSKKRSIIKAQLHARPNVYGFGADWILVLTNTRTKRVRSFWLGQACKFTSRILGWDYEDFLDTCMAEVGSRNYYDKRVQRWIVQQIIKGITDNSPEKLKDIFDNAESWSLSAE